MCRRTRPLLAAIALTALGVGALAIPATGEARADAPRYQMVKDDDGTLWRLNTETGEIAMCKAEAGRMVCVSSGDNIDRTTMSATDLEAAEARKREARAQEQTDMLSRLVDVFERLVSIVTKYEAERVAPAAEKLPDGPATSRPPPN